MRHPGAVERLAPLRGLHRKRRAFQIRHSETAWPYRAVGLIGFIIGSIVLVALYRALPPPGTPLMLIRRVEGYGIDQSWRRSMTSPRI